MEARKRAGNLTTRMTKAGYFIADDGTTAVLACVGCGLADHCVSKIFNDMEKDPVFRSNVLATIKKSLDYELRVTGEDQ